MASKVQRGVASQPYPPPPGSATDSGPLPAWTWFNITTFSLPSSLPPTLSPSLSPSLPLISAARFAFVEYDSHRAAAMARRKLMNGRVYLWGHQLAVDWAEPELEVDEEIMAQVCYGTVCGLNNTPAPSPFRSVPLHLLSL